MTQDLINERRSGLTQDSLQIARLEVRMSQMDRDMQAQTLKMDVMSAQLDQVLTALSEAKGGWKTMMWLGGAAAVVGGCINWLIEHVSLR